jgi:Phage P22-like portal protein
MWATANTAPRPYLIYNIDKDAPEVKPSREAPIDMPAGSLALAQQDAENIQATTGAFNPALGNANDMNRVSGTALVQHTSRGDLASHEFIDNYGKALQLLAECGVDMIPTIMDTERIERIVHPDGSDENVPINKVLENGDILNELKKGRYDTTVTIGPSYQTARQEALSTLISAADTLPQIRDVAPDLIASRIDDPIAVELVKRLRKPLIAQGIVQPTEQEKKTMGPPPPPDPMHVAEVQRAQALASEDTAKALIAHNKANSSNLEQAKLIADIVSQHLENILNAQKAHAGNPDVITAQVEADATRAQTAQTLATPQAA